MGDLAGWPYWKVISITGQSGAGTDYQVELEIGDSAGGDFHLEGHCTNFPQDIRITDDDGTTLLDYWVEDLTADPIIVHVEVKDDLGSNRDVRVYYGKNGETTVSNIGNTMIEGDDFNRSNAEVVGNGWSDVDSFDIESNQMKYDYVSGIETWKAVTHGTYVYHIDVITKTSQPTRIIVSAGANEECILLFDSSDNQCKYLRGQPSVSWIILGTYVDAREYAIEFVWHDDTNKWDISVVSSATDWSASNIDHYDGVAASGTNRFEIDNMGTSADDVWFDNFYVRKYNSPEPAFSSAGAEQSPTVGAIMNQFQRANIGADLYNGVLA